MNLFGSLRSQASVFRKVNDIVHFTELHCVRVWCVFQRGKSSVGRLALESGVWLLMGDKERRHEFKLQHCALKQPFVYRAKIILCILLGREEVVTCALQNGKGGYGERGGPRGVWEGGGEQAAARPWRAGRRRQRGSEGGPGTAARLGGRPGDGSAARREARIRQRGSVGGTHGDGSAARREARRLGVSAARKEAWRRQRGSVGGPETVRFGERESGEVEEAVQCSHSKNHSPFLK